MDAFGRTMRRVLIAVVLLAGSVILAPGVGAKGNSDAAHACQNGGYADLQGADGTTFANVGECVRYAAHGGELTPVVKLPTLTIGFVPSGGATGTCSVVVSVKNFTPNTFAGVVIERSDFGPFSAGLRIDGSGSGSDTFPTYSNIGSQVNVHAGGLESGWTPVSC